MQRTSNYQLPQWEKEDRILMEDFNGAMANIESGIGEAKGVADTAKADAERAEGKADAAQATADAAYCPDNMPYVIGSYTGTDAEQTIDLGFKTPLLIVAEHWSPSHPCMGAVDISIHTPPSGSLYGTYRLLEITSTGFKLYSQTSYQSTSTDAPQVNKRNGQYTYIAFK